MDLEAIIKEYQVRIVAPTVTTDEQKTTLIQLAILQGYLAGMEAERERSTVKLTPDQQKDFDEVMAIFQNGEVMKKAKEYQAQIDKARGS